jgi:hypothetical protein
MPGTDSRPCRADDVSGPQGLQHRLRHPYLRPAAKSPAALSKDISMPDLYAMTVPVFIRAFRNLDHVLAKAEGSGIADDELVGARLIADMLPLSKQVQIASDTARFAAVRVGQAAPAAMADDETTLAQLRERVAKTIAWLETVDAAGFAGREEAEVVLKMSKGEVTFTGHSYVTDFALPNFFFHVTMAYALLRMKGVPLGKMDFLAGGAAIA